MRITNLEIRNYRGIKSADIVFPLDSRIICFIGAGDSTKSTLIKAIEWNLWPSWNLVVSDSDFYECNVSENIVIRCTYTELPDRLIAEDRFGLYLRKPNVSIGDGIDDEPNDREPICLTIQLTIDKSLEPKWEVVCNRNEPKTLSLTDRKLLLSNSIGSNCSKDMVWGKFSVLQKYADAKGTLQDVQTTTLRDIAQKADLQELDDISETIESVGKKYGVGFNGEISNHMQIQGVSLTTTVGLFDGKAPLSQRGLGSQRLLSMGLNIKAASNNSLLLIDEIESGLEPYRLRNLINELRQSHLTTGQVIMTTHSPIVVAECTISEILVIQSDIGETKAYELESENPEINKNLQAEIRRNAEAFLSKRIIVCEGKTEIGFIRALDTYLSNTAQFRLAFSGIGTADGNGNSIFDCAQRLMACGYDVCLFMDSDLENEKEQKEELRGKGISVFDWAEPNAFEEQVFQDVSTDSVNQLIGIAISEYGIDSVKSRLPESIKYRQEENKIIFEDLDSEQRKVLGKIAKTKKIEWYKRIDLGESVGNLIFKDWDNIDEKCKLKQIINSIIELTKHD